MSAPTLHREPKASERPWPWVAFAAVMAGASVMLVALATSGALESIIDKSFLGRELRGYTGTGLFMGVSSVFFSLLAMTYSLRKRAMQEKFPVARMTMMAWLWAHVALGGLAFVAALLHAGFGLVSFSFTTGKLLLFVFTLLVVSGVVWRVIYAAVPSIAAPRIGNYSMIGNERRAEEQTTEIEKLAAGRSADVRRVKDWLVEAERAPNDVQNAIVNFSPEDRAVLLEIHELAGSRRRALERIELQRTYTRLLQAWRVAHIPLTILFVPILVWHVVAALEIPARLSSVGAVPFPSLSGLHASSECASCHKTIVEQWKHSMHAHALTSPMTVAQNNQLLQQDLGEAPSPDPRQVCTNCHGPVQTAITDDPRLPMQRALYPRELLDEGVGCTTCHHLDREVGTAGTMGLTRSQAFFKAGSTYYGQYDDAVGNAFHRSEASGIWKDGEPERLCVGCHDVSYDTNGDGKIVKGQDLVLQQVVDEWGRWQKLGGTGTCLTCHMPVVAGATRLADAASIPFEQDNDAPAREVHDHSFVGVDYPIADVAKDDPQKGARERLMREAGRIKIDDATIDKGALSFKVRLTNVGAGHNLPTGFAFARQLWLEVVVKDGAGHTVLSSGVLDDPTRDLCDDATMTDPGPMAKLVEGCTKSDPFLVNLQQKLVTKFQIVVDEKTGEKQVDDNGEFKIEAADGAVETSIQHLRVAPVPRTRPFDKSKLTTLQPREERKFPYKIDLPDSSSAKIKVRLMFRSLPPYFLRELAKGQAADEVQLEPLIANLQIMEVDVAEQTVK